MQADDGTSEVWLMDGNVRRHVVNQTSYLAWRFDRLGKVPKWPAATVQGYKKGPNWPTRPFVMRGSGAAVYLLDSWPGTSASLDGGVDAGGTDDGCWWSGGADQGAPVGSVEAGPPVASSGPGSLKGGGCQVAGDDPLGPPLPALLLVLALTRRRRKNRVE